MIKFFKSWWKRTLASYDEPLVLTKAMEVKPKKKKKKKKK
jgi:hypothetical protein